MRIRTIALCLGPGVTPGLALRANAGYDVTVLQDAGGQGDSDAIAIDAYEQIVGFSFTKKGADAVL